MSFLCIFLCEIRLINFNIEFFAQRHNRKSKERMQAAPQIAVKSNTYVFFKCCWKLFDLVVDDFDAGDMAFPFVLLHYLVAGDEDDVRKVEYFIDGRVGDDL